jgi:hypothetical protein
MNRVRGQAIIVWKNDEMKQAYEQHLASLQRAGAGGE